MHTKAEDQIMHDGGKRAGLSRRLSNWCFGLAAAAFLAVGCGGPRALVADMPEAGSQESHAVSETASSGSQVSQPAPVDLGDATQTLAIDGDVGDLLGDLGLPSDDEATERIRDQLVESLLPSGIEANDEAVASAIAARLGPSFQGETDIGVLIGALASELGAGAPIESVDDLLDAVNIWAEAGVVTFGPGADSVATITTSTTFDQAVSLIDLPGVTIDVLPGVASFDIADVAVDVDQASRRIRIAGMAPAPLSGTATVTVTWSGDGPRLVLDLVPGATALGDFVPGVSLGELGRVPASELAVRLDDNGFAATGQIVAGAIPGLEQLGLGSQAVPVDFATSGFGPWSAQGVAEPITLTLPLAGLPLLGRWNVAREASVDVLLSSDPAVGYRETLTARFGGEELVFRGEGTVENGGPRVVLALVGDWVAPFGAHWLTVRNVELRVLTDSSTQSAMISGDYVLAGKRGTIEFALDGGDATTARARGTLDDLVASDLTAIAQTLTGTALLPAGSTLPNDVLSLRDVVVSFAADGNENRVTLSATTQLLGEAADAVLSLVPVAEGGNIAVLAVQPRDVALARLFPALAGNDIVGDLRLPNSAFVFTSRDVRTAGDRLDPTLAASVVPNGRGEVQLRAGISLAAAIPAGSAPVIDDLKETLGMDRAEPLRLSGTVPADALRGGGGAFVLNATLPPMSPAGNAEWFVSAELALRITSESSVSIVGSMILDLQGDVQTFEIEASIERGVGGVSIAFVGRLGSVWESPFGVEWLTLNQVVLQLGIEPARGVTIGFLGDIIVGSKDLRGAMAITVSPAGVPTNFVFEATSLEGVSLGDLADVYALISGQARPPVEAVLPAVEIRDIELRFAPQGNADLDVQQGFKIAGEWWMASSIGGPLELIAAVDLEISDRGLVADGFLTDFALGPVAFDQSRLSVFVSAADQRLSFSGGVQIAGSAAQIAVAVSRSEMAFATTGRFGDSEATLEIAASYDLTNPAWSVRAILNEQFIRDVDAATTALIGKEVSDLNSQIGTARTGLTAAQTGLDVAEVALRAAQAVVGPTCLGPFQPLCTAVDNAQRDVEANRQKVQSLQAQLNRGEALLDQYDVQLTVVGAEFEVALSAMSSNQVMLDLIVDASGQRVPVPVAWDFNKTIDANLDGLLDQIAAIG